MLEWVCPHCERLVHPSLEVCPFCGGREAARPAQPRARQRFAWADFERGFRIGLGLVAALAAAYFVIFLVAYYGGHEELVDRLARWLRWR